MRRSRALLRPNLFSIPLFEPALHEQDGCNRTYNSWVFQMLRGLSKDRVASSLVLVLKLDSVDLLEPWQACQLSCEGVWKYLLSSRSLTTSNLLCLCEIQVSTLQACPSRSRFRYTFLLQHQWTWSNTIPIYNFRCQPLPNT